MSDHPKDIPKHLQQELLKNIQVQGNLTTGDITQIGSQFVLNLDKSPRPTGIPQNLPRSGVSNFVGREEALATLHQQLQHSDQVAISAIAGMGSDQIYLVPSAERILPGITINLTPSSRISLT